MCLFLRARAADKFFLRAASTLEEYKWRAASTSSYFISLPLAGISLLLIGNVVLRQVIVNNRAETSKSEQSEVQTKSGSTNP